MLQDNVKLHKAPAALAAAISARLSFIQGYPPYSPDLNPIENLFGIVLKKMGVLDLKEPIVGTGRVEKSITRFRNLLSAEVAKGTLKTLARSMPRRLKAVIDAKGGPTRY